MGEKPVLPRPTFRDVILVNPLFNKTEEIRTKLEKMPEKNREQYLRDNVENAWDRVEVLKVAKGCEEVKEGDFVSVDANIVVNRGFQIHEGEFVQVPETAIKGVW